MNKPLISVLLTLLPLHYEALAEIEAPQKPTVVTPTFAGAEDTLPPLKDGKAPTTVAEAWVGFEPRKEPLDVEVLKEWEEDGVVVKVIRYRVGIFKGKPAMMAAVYGYPKGAKNLPGLVQIHGGGQSAQSSFVVKDAKNGYATISVAWSGRIIATEYKVTNKEKEMFWTGNTEDPDYRVTTDWGAVDAYHHHCRFKGNNFVQNPPSESTVDPVRSPRNSGWFLVTMGTRRAITFLEQQPQVDRDRIGVYGMSMGGKLTVLTAGSDSRVKAAAPACGGLSDLSSKGRTLAPVADDKYLERITCPTIIMSPSNDFHSNVQDIPQAVKDMKSREWRVVSSPNRNHGDSSEYSVGTLLWFNQFLKGSFTMAETPTTKLTLKTADNTPRISVASDQSQTIQAVNVYYTQDGNRKPVDKYWRVGKPLKTDGALTFQLPLVSVDKPLWAYADVQYALGRTVEGVGYSGEGVKTDSYHLASVVEMVSAEELTDAGAMATIDESVLREDFDAYRPGSDLKTAFPAFTFSDGISCVADPGPRPGMSLKMKDSPDFEYAWLPLLTLNTAIAPFIGTDKWTCSADVMLDAREPVPITVEFRAKDHKKKFTPIIVDAAGAISARGKTTTKLCAVPPGTWWRFSVTYDVNDSKNYQVTIQDAEGGMLARECMETQMDVGGVNWVGFIVHANATGSLYVDNVSLQQVDAPSNYVDGVAPGGIFRYGIHDLKWVEDVNGSRLMDLGEVHRKKADQWGDLGQQDFNITVARRRSCMYLPNAYVYKKTPTRDLELYIDFPEGWKPTDKRPAILWFFGGAWSVGSPTAFKPQAEYFATRGVVGICVDYRIGKVDGNDRNDYRGALDGKTAIRWVRKNAARLGIDPDRIMAGGDSAGGHIPVATQIPTLNDPEDDQAISGKLSALLMHNPYVVRISAESWVFQLDFKTLPPVWIAYGLNDKAAYNDKPGNRREERNGENFIAELKKAGIPLRTYLKEGFGHGFCSGPHLDPSTRDIDDFLQQCGLLPPPATERPDKITGAARGRHVQAALAGKVKRTDPKMLEFPTVAPAPR